MQKQPKTFVLHTHVQIHACIKNHNDTIMTSNTVFRKNIPLTLFERVVCERELETEQNCNILTPTLLAITAFLFHSPGLLNQEPGAQLLWDMFSFQHLLSNWSDPQLSIGGPEAPSAGCWLSLPHLVSNWSGLQTD